MQEHIGKHVLDLLKEFNTHPYYIALYDIPDSLKLVGFFSLEEAISYKKDNGGIVIMSLPKKEV